MRELRLVTVIGLLCLAGGFPVRAEPFDRADTPSLITQTFSVGNAQYRLTVDDGSVIRDDLNGQPAPLPARQLTITPLAGGTSYEEQLQDWPLGAMQVNTEKGLIVTQWEASTAYRIIVFQVAGGNVRKVFDDYSKMPGGVAATASGDLIISIAKDCPGDPFACEQLSQIVRASDK
jgi:hypothetical protein